MYIASYVFLSSKSVTAYTAASIPSEFCSAMKTSKNSLRVPWRQTLPSVFAWTGWRWHDCTTDVCRAVSKCGTSARHRARHPSLSWTAWWVTTTCTLTNSTGSVCCGFVGQQFVTPNPHTVFTWPPDIVSLLRHVRREWALLSLHSVCLSGCLSVIPRPTAYHDWSITTKFGRQVYTCPQTHVRLFGSPISHTFGARRQNTKYARILATANVTHRDIWLVLV